jgi:polyisoprenoid-binding protein YceI
MKTKLMQLVVLAALTLSSAFAVEIDTSKSTLNWLGTKITGKHFGKVPFKSGSVELKKGKVVGGEFVADLANLTIEDIKGEWATKFLGHIKSKDFFEVDKFPTATIKIKSVKGSTATAALTIKGKTHDVKFDIKEAKGVYSGVLKFDRTKFGMVYGSGDFFKGLGDKTIHNDVEVDFSFIVKK